MSRFAAILAAAAMAVPVPAPPVNALILTVRPGSLPIATGQCNGGRLLVGLTNGSGRAIYANAVITAAGALHLQRTLISTWLPAGHTSTVPVSISAATGTPAGTYRVQLTGGPQPLTVPVTVSPPAPTPNLARLASQVDASSIRAEYPVCGALDGDANPADWGHGTGWADGTGRQWPDTYQLTWPTPQAVSRVDLTTVNSAQYPTSKYGLRDWDIQIGTVGGWQTVAEVRGNVTATVSSGFPAQLTDKLRIVTYAANGLNDQSRIVELAVY
jgi:hypothetical protein